MARQPVNIPAYIDEAGAKGYLRKLKPQQDHEIGLLCALVFDPDTHDKAKKAFTPAFEKFRDAAPVDAKLHITEAFKKGNEEWARVARQTRCEFIDLINEFKPTIIYSARRLGILRNSHEFLEECIVKSKEDRRSSITISGENRASDDRIEDELISMLAIRLDVFADEIASQCFTIGKTDLLFDENDMKNRYEAQIQKTREVSYHKTEIKGYDPNKQSTVTAEITSQVIGAPFEVDTKHVGKIQVLGKDHPLILAVDIVANYLNHHLKKLPQDMPLNAPESIVGWKLEERVWGISENAIRDLI